MLLNAAKCQGYSFHRLWVIKRKPAMGGGKTSVFKSKIIIITKKIIKIIKQ